MGEYVEHSMSVRSFYIKRTAEMLKGNHQIDPRHA